MEEMFSISGKNYKVNNYHFKKYFLSRKVIFDNYRNIYRNF